MKTNAVVKASLSGLLAAMLISAGAGAAENLTDAIELVRTTYKADRQTFLAETLQLTASEGEVFWPFYRTYRADIDKFGDGLVKLVLEYADNYPNVPEKRAQEMLKEYSELEERLASKRAWYYRRAGKLIPATKALRWAQLENRLDLILRLQIAGAVPLVPAVQSKQ